MRVLYTTGRVLSRKGRMWSLKSQFAFASLPNRSEELSCWKCRSVRSPCDTRCSKCNSIQNIKDCDYFSLFEMPLAFRVDDQKIEQRFKYLQKQYHPDLFGGASDEEKDISMQGSSYVNQAYQILRDPIARAMYILQLNNIKTLEEGETVVANPQLAVARLITIPTI